MRREVAHEDCGGFRHREHRVSLDLRAGWEDAFGEARYDGFGEVEVLTREKVSLVQLHLQVCDPRAVRAREEGTRGKRTEKGTNLDINAILLLMRCLLRRRAGARRANGYLLAGSFRHVALAGRHGVCLAQNAMGEKMLGVWEGVL